MIRRCLAWGVWCLLLAAPVSAFTGTGTPTDPIIAMSCDPVQTAKDIRASLAFFGHSDDAYWLERANHTTGPFSNGLYSCGWNKYWEFRAEHPELSAGSPDDIKLPALHTDGTGVPPVTPPTTPVVVLDQSAVLAAIADVRAAVERVSQEQEAIAAEHRTMHAQVVGLIQALPQTLPPAPSGPSTFGKIGGALGAIFTNPAVLTGIGTVLVCVTTKKCG